MMIARMHHPAVRSACSFPGATTIAKLVPVVAAAVMVAGSGARTLHAQAPARSAAATPAATAERMAAEGDSSGAIAHLQEAVKRDNRDASAWHKLGAIAWARSRSQGRKESMPVEMARLRSLADSALRYATQLAPDSALFWYDLAKYSLNTGNVFVRGRAAGYIERGIAMAEQRGDSALWSRMLDEQGMTAWRAYHALAHRALKGNVPDYVPDMSGQKNSATSGRGLLQDQGAPGAVPIEVRRDKWAPYFREFLQPLNPPTGLADFTKATDAFRKALQVNPSNRLARQHLFMTLVETSRWRELHTAAAAAIRHDSSFAEAWLARGLASVRLNDTPDALIAFDAAIKVMAPDQLGAFTDFRRLLPPHSTGRPSLFPDSVQYSQSTPALRQRWESLYWNLADPRASTPVNEARLEHFARVAHADLLWSSDDFDLRGSDSDRGDVLIRYGPPDVIYSHDATTAAEMGSAAAAEQTHVLIWVYNNDLAFVFSMTTGYGTAFTAIKDRVAVDSIRDELPVSWSNMKTVQRTLPMLSRAARFRASRDSMDVIIATAVPVRSLLQNSELGGALPIDVQLDVHDPQSQIIGRQKQQASVPGDNLPIGIDAWWVRRLGTGLNVIRVDAEQKDVERAAVSKVEVTVVDSGGFGLSDILFSAVPATASGSGAPKRWTDLQIKPNVGLFPGAQPIGLVWENYNLANENGNARYRVTINLERTFANNARGIGARIMANLRNVAQGSSRGTGALSLSYDELRPHGEAIVDFLSISLTESVPGPYRITVRILDLVSGKTTQRTADFRLFQ